MASVYSRIASAIRSVEERVTYDMVLTAVAHLVGGIFRAEKILSKWEESGMIFFDEQGEAHV